MKTKIKEIMKHRNISTFQLAQTLGKSVSTINQTINHVGTVKSLEQIANGLGVPLWTLFVDEKEVRSYFNIHVTSKCAQSFVCPHCGKSLSVHITPNDTPTDTE